MKVEPQALHANVHWRNYQQEVAKFFEQLGYVAAIDATLRGARGNHKIDVLLSPKRGIVAHKWLVECKCWSSRVPKEKVLAFQQIVADTGADKGFLLTTVGYQKGAIKAAENTNIILTTLEELLQKVEQVWMQWPNDFDFDLYETWYEAEEDDGMGPGTGIYLRRRDGQPLVLPLTCLISDTDGRVWRYELGKHDLNNGIANVCIPFHFNGEPPDGTAYRVAWRTSDGPIFLSTYVCAAK